MIDRFVEIDFKRHSFYTYLLNFSTFCGNKGTEMRAEKPGCCQLRCFRFHLYSVAFYNFFIFIFYRNFSEKKEDLMDLHLYRDSEFIMNKGKRSFHIFLTKDNDTDNDVVTFTVKLTTN